jgi:TrmH family RNA methyltransferase
VKRIASPGNPLLKRVRQLARGRRRSSELLLEGRKLVEAALESGVALDCALVSSGDRAPTGLARAIEARGIQVIELPESLFRSVSSVDSPEGILALARRPIHSPSELQAKGIILVADGIQDPGNLGALARLVEASGSAGLAILKGSADPFSPKAIRGSMGSLLRVPVYELPDLSTLTKMGFRLAALVPRGGIDFRKADYSTPLAILLGREATGIPESSLAAANLRLSIPMRGRVESLNVATAAALVLYEANRNMLVL